MSISPENPAEGSNSLSRRTIVAGAAWTVPVIAVATAAPLAAASRNCGPGSVNYSNGYTRTSPTSGSGTGALSNGGTVGYTLSAAYGANVTPPANNLTVYNPPAGGPAQLNILANSSTTGTTNRTPQNAYTTTLTYTFASPVSNVVFTLWDVDSAEYPAPAGAYYKEYVRVAAPGVTAVPGSGVSTGTPNTGWYTPNAYGDQGATNPAYAVTYTIPGPVTSFQIFMSRPNNLLTTVGASGGIGLSGLTFSVPC